MEFKRKCLPLVGIRALRCLNAFQALLIGIKMLPAYQHLTVEELVGLVDEMPREDQLKVILSGAKIVALDPEEVKALVCFCTDKNGIPYTEANIKTLGPSDLVEVIVTVCMEVIQNMHIDLVTEEEKKNSSPGQLTSVEPI